MNLPLSRDNFGCPYLFLAPMEGVGDRAFRKAMASVGGFDEAVTEFISIPMNAHVESLTKHYRSDELGTVPLTPQIMGADPGLLAAAAFELEKRGAPRIDINCGCPSNTVTGRGAGSSLLKDPSILHEVVREVVKAVSVPVTVKMRSGYEDLSLFTENLRAVEQGGAAYLTLHPRTKIDGYGPPAQWDLIKQAKKTVRIPVVGNGDVVCPATASELLNRTSCDGLMIGRGAVMNPFIFLEIRGHFSGISFRPGPDDLEKYLQTYFREMEPELSEKGRIGKLKQLTGFLCRSNPLLLAKRGELLKTNHTEALDFLESLRSAVRSSFFEKNK